MADVSEPQQQPGGGNIAAREPAIRPSGTHHLSRLPPPPAHRRRRRSLLPKPKKNQTQQTPPQRVPSLPMAATQLANVLSGLHHTFVVADNTLPDCPLVYASEG